MTDKQIFDWLQEQNYPTWFDDAYVVYYEEDMPRILREFMDYCQWLAQKPK